MNLPFILFVGARYFKEKRKTKKTASSLLSITGIAVGVMIAAGWWASGFGSRPAGITFASNTGYLLTYPLVGYPTQVTWSMVMLLGVPVGAFAGAWRAGDFRLKLPPGWSLLKIFGGGLLMGGAALLAEGCNINQGLTNSATPSVTTWRLLRRS